MKRYLHRTNMLSLVSILILIISVSLIRNSLAEEKPDASNSIPYTDNDKRCPIDWSCKFVDSNVVEKNDTRKAKHSNNQFDGKIPERKTDINKCQKEINVQEITTHKHGLSYERIREVPKRVCVESLTQIPPIK